MARPKSSTPSLRPHISGQSIVVIDGRTIYLGPHGSPEAFARYAVIIQTYQANGLRLPTEFDFNELSARTAALFSPVTAATHQAELPILVRHLTAAYREHLKKRYANHDSQAEYRRLLSICDEMDAHNGDLVVSKYGPLTLIRQRTRWVDSGKARTYCNRLTHSVVRIFKWGVAQELVEESTWNRLLSVESLRYGTTEAPETEPVVPVDLQVVRATAKELSPVLKSMVRIQIATGMRPAEICRMRPCDIDRTGAEWMYRPSKHKTAHKGKTKAVPIVGDAREALIDFLNRDPESYCFSPTESVAWWRAKQRSERKSKVQPSQRDRSKAKPETQPGECYTPLTYRQVIRRAAKRAGVATWHPYQLRHLAATTAREALGAEAAQALLGHARVCMTEHYARLSEAKAIEAAKHAPTLTEKNKF